MFFFIYDKELDEPPFCYVLIIVTKEKRMICQNTAKSQTIFYLLKKQNKICTRYTIGYTKLITQSYWQSVTREKGGESSVLTTLGLAK